MKDKNDCEIKDGDTVRIDAYELKEPNGKVYHVIPQEVCRVGMIDGVLRYLRSGGWNPAVNSEPWVPKESRTSYVEVL